MKGRGDPVILKLGTLICLFSMSCGKTNEAPLFHPPLNNFEEASLHCEDPNHCPESTGAFVFQTLHSEGLCTGSLISPDLVLTNSHCVPDEFKTSESRLGNRAKVIFAETAGKATQSILVRRVLEYSVIEQTPGQTFGKSPDYAILELESSVPRRTPIRISAAGLPEDFSFDLYSVNPDPKNGMQGLLQIKHCRTTMGSAYQPSYDNPFAAVVSFSDCEMVHGNSGSAMVDEEGFARGIVHAGLDPASRMRLSKEFDLAPLSPLFLATNLACLPIFSPTGLLPVPCSVPIPQMDAPAGIRFFLEQSARADAPVSPNSYFIDSKLRHRPNPSL